MVAIVNLLLKKIMMMMQIVNTVSVTYQHALGEFVVRQASTGVFVENPKELSRSEFAIFHELNHFLDWRHALLCITQHTLNTCVTAAA